MILEIRPLGPMGEIIIYDGNQPTFSEVEEFRESHPTIVNSFSEKLTAQVRKTDRLNGKYKLIFRRKQ